jgi:hypothetical protein
MREFVEDLGTHPASPQLIHHLTGCHPPFIHEPHLPQAARLAEMWLADTRFTDTRHPGARPVLDRPSAHLARGAPADSRARHLLTRRQSTGHITGGEQHLIQAQ